MPELFIDIETYSSRNLKKVGAYKYAESPDFEILMAAYAIDDDPVQIVFGDDIAGIPGLWDPRVLKVAHNAAFERICFSALGRTVMECESFLDPRQYDDTMALAAEWGYPQKLEFLAQVLGVTEKDSAGTRLINLFCKPDRKGNRVMPEDKPEEWEAFCRYCIQDVETLRAVRRALGDWPTQDEREFWIADQMINDRGLRVDVHLAQQAIAAAEDNTFGQDLEFMMLTGVSNPGSLPQVLSWIRRQGVEIPNLQAKTVETLMLDPDLDPTVRRVFELRQDLALVAAKKYTAAVERANTDGRVRGAFQFYGAHTGRWSGRGAQPQNLPSATIGEKDDPGVDEKIRQAVAKVKAGEGSDAYTLKALVRAMFVGPFTVVDYAAIEARVVSWLAGEEWALQAFRDGRDIYVETAQRMGGLTRKEGKVAVLALGYNGGVDALRRMGAEGNKAHLQFLVDQWRGANPSIKGLWQEMQNAFRYGDRPVGEHLYIEKDGADRYIKLPSGRHVAYHGLKGKMETDDWGNPRMRITYASPQMPGRRTKTYGGALTENITQAVARDILAEAILRLHSAGHTVVGHVHDEVIIEGTPSVEEITDIMVEAPAWSEGLPISAEGFSCPRYRKG